MKNILHKIFPLLLFIICCVVFVLLYRQIDITKNAYKDIETEWNTEAQRRLGIRLLNSSFSKIQGDKKILDEHFAESSNIVPFLDTIEATGKKVGVDVEVLSVDVPKDSKSLNIELRGTGSFGAVYKFILLLENAPYELDFTSMGIEKDVGAVGTKDASAWVVNLKIRLLSFVL